MYKRYNPNPKNARVGDCVIRACCKMFDMPWDDMYMELCLCGLTQHDMPSANAVWGKYLREHGFTRHIIPDTCPECYTVRDFAREHPNGMYILSLNGHVVACKNGDYFDTWDSGDEVPICYWKKEAKE